MLFLLTISKGFYYVIKYIFNYIILSFRTTWARLVGCVGFAGGRLAEQGGAVGEPTQRSTT